MKSMPGQLPKILLTLFVFILLANCANAVVSVNPGERIQAAIDAAKAGETIEIYGGTYVESLVVDRPIILKGIVSGADLPCVNSESGSAITIKANGVIVEGLWAKSASGWKDDAGILVLSNDNILRGCAASGSGNVGILLEKCRNNTVSDCVIQGNGNEGLFLENSSGNILKKSKISDNRYGCKLVSSPGNSILENDFLKNRVDAINLQHSDANLIEGNSAAGSDSALSIDESRDNIVRKNEFTGNEKGIYLSYLDTSSETQSKKGKGVVISYNSMPSSDAATNNNSIYLNTLINKNNARDDSLNNWDNGKIGNNYSDFNDPAEGCKGKKICDRELSISGGPSVDRYPQASPVAVAGRITGSGGAIMQLSARSYLPASRMDLNFTAPVGQEVWVRQTTPAAPSGNASQTDLYLGQNFSGDAWLTAPSENGSYQLDMIGRNGSKVLSVPYSVAIPSISASPASVYTCEKITVAFQGAFGRSDDWIGIYQEGSSSATERQMLGSRGEGNVTFSPSSAGKYLFKMFSGQSADPLASTDPVEVRATAGCKVIAEPSRVPPGGIVTITFWGAAPASVIGMYGMTRPDRFDLGKVSTGGRSCGTMVRRLPYEAGQYDFRLF
ncbi:MAG: NosD domain-containing protein, partial [Methanothrix sp.]|nr:NosD domain-containing protein [Methanothrix sp.]